MQCGLYNKGYMRRGRRGGAFSALTKVAVRENQEDAAFSAARSPIRSTAYVWAQFSEPTDSGV